MCKETTANAMVSKDVTGEDASAAIAAASGPKITCGADLGVHETSLEDRAGAISIWMLSYLTPMLRLGSHKVLESSDIGIPPDQDRAERAYTLSMAAWERRSAHARTINGALREKYEAKRSACTNERQRAKLSPPKYVEPSIARSLIEAYGVSKLVIGLLYYIAGALLSFVPVLILSDLVAFFESDSDEWNGRVHPWLEVLGLAVLPFLVSLLQTRHFTIFTHCAVFVRTAVSTMLYRKALRVSAAGRAKTSTGQVVNMMSNDTAQLQRFLQFAGLTMVAPVQIVIALTLIFQQVRC